MVRLFRFKAKASSIRQQGRRNLGQTPKKPTSRRRGRKKRMGEGGGEEKENKNDKQTKKGQGDCILLLAGRKWTTC